MNKDTDNNVVNEDDKVQKIQSLRDMINNAERTIHSAKAMLLQLEGKKKEGRRKKVEEGDGNVVHGTFDGQTMVGTDGRQYPVPANYASKSKLVEGDLLKLTIGDNGAFMYKQVGPVPRQNKIGIVSQDERGNFFVMAENKPYRVLLASITYFKAEPGDEVVVVTSSEEDAKWASLESVLRKAEDLPAEFKQDNFKVDFSEINSDDNKKETSDSIVNEWVPDINEIEKEIKEEMRV